MSQFDSLCRDNISGSMDPYKHTNSNEDLAGYLDIVRIQIDKCLNVRLIDRLRDSGWEPHVHPDLDTPASSAINRLLCAGKSSHSSLKTRPMSASSQRSPPANKHNGQNCKSDSNTKSQYAPSQAGEASS
ncbi:hypothetical protein GJ496_010970 [Pomphorhynchus laevis]|nr:hypothetical protein GJ496_010970 [Pomphorhynchus laevis]